MKGRLLRVYIFRLSFSIFSDSFKDEIDPTMENLLLAITEPVEKASDETADPLRIEVREDGNFVIYFVFYTLVFHLLMYLI